MRTGKFFVFIVAGFIALGGAVLLSLWLWVNPNDYKGRIAAAVKESTGRVLVLQGNIRLSVFPWIALELGPATLSNPSGFASEPFLSFRNATVRINLLPLLHERLEVARVQIDGLDVHLQRNAEGAGNWQTSGGDAKGREPAPAQGTAEAARDLVRSLRELADIRVHDGRVSYENFTLEKIDLETGTYGANQMVPVILAFDANRGTPSEHVTVDAKFDLSADPATRQWLLAAVSLSGLFNRAGDPRPWHWELSAPSFDLATDAETLTAPAFAVNLSGAHLTGRLRAEHLRDDAAVTGSVILAPMVLREFIARLGIESPKTHDPHALAALSASSDFSYRANGLQFDKLQVRLDDTSVQGTLAVLDLDSDALKFNLSADRIDVDRYLSGVDKPADAPPAAAAGVKGAAENAKPLDADGILTVGAVRFSNVDFNSVRIGVTSKAGVVHLFPSQAKVEGGRYSGDITLDGRGATPTLAVNEHLYDIDMDQLAANDPKKTRLSGRGNLDLKATAHGTSMKSLLGSMNGHLDAAVQKGAIEGVDVGYELNRVETLIGKDANPTINNTRRTTFDALKSSAEITNGVAKLQNLTISSPHLRVTGQGSANLASQAIDVKLLASLLRSPTETAADIPLRVTGTYTDPKLQPDLAAFVKNQLRQKLHDRLQGLFGK